MKIVVTHLYKSKERKMAKKPLEKLLSFPTRNRTRDLQDASRALYPPRHQHLPLIFRYTSLFHLAYIYIYLIFREKYHSYHASGCTLSKLLVVVFDHHWRVIFLFPPSSTMPRLPMALATVTTGNYYYV